MTFHGIKASSDATDGLLFVPGSDSAGLTRVDEPLALDMRSPLGTDTEDGNEDFDG